MNILSALYFPETNPDPKIIARLLLFFKKITHYRANEDVKDNAAIEAEGLYAYPPAPLGDDLEEFNNILKHLRNIPESPEQLDALSLANLSNSFAADRDEMSSSGLVTAMLRHGKTRQDRKQPELWQARIVLKLAEALDLEEREINKKLTNIADHEHRLFKSLRGPENEEEGPSAENKNLFSLANPLITTGQTFSSHNAPTTRHRVKAWARLFLADHNQERPDILATAWPEAAAQLFEGHEKLTGQQAIRLFSIAIPDLPELTDAGLTDPNYQKIQASFRKDRTQYLQAIENVLQKAMADKTATIKNADEHYAPHDNITSWNKAVTDIYGPTSEADNTLTFYSLPGITPARLLAHICDEPPPEQPGNESNHNVILATFLKS